MKKVKIYSWQIIEYFLDICYNYFVKKNFEKNNLQFGGKNEKEKNRCRFYIIFISSNGFCLGDSVLATLNIPTWSNSANAIGTHYTVFYTFIFLIPALVLAFKYKDDMFAKVGKWLSIIFTILLILGMFFMF